MLLLVVACLLQFTSLPPADSTAPLVTNPATDSCLQDPQSKEPVANVSLPVSASPEKTEKNSPEPGVSLVALNLPDAPVALIKPAKASPPKQETGWASPKRQWLALTILQHSAATFDGWTTRRVVATGLGHETNPFLHAASDSAAIYPTIQLMSLGLDFVGARMQRSSRPWVRRFWWVPQAANMSIHIRDGVHNLHVYSALKQRQ